MRRVWSGRRSVRAILAAAVVMLPVGSLTFALDAPSGKSNPSTTQPAKPEKSDAASTSTETAKPQPGPNGHIVQRGDLNLEMKLDGLFTPAEVYELRPMFKVYGSPIIINSIAAPGSKVKKGDSLLEADTTGINWALAQAESDFAVTKATLTKAASDVALGAIGDAMQLKQAEDAVKLAEAGKKWFDEMDGPHMLKTAELQAQLAKAEVDDQGDELDQLKKMYKDDQLTASTADIVVRRALRRFDYLKTTSKMRQEATDKTKTLDYPNAKQKAYEGVDSAKQLLALTKSMQAQTQANRQASLNSAKIAMEQITRRLAELREDLNWFSVKAPADGVVAYGTLVEGQWIGGDPRTLKPGERIGSGQPVLRVYSPGKLKVTLAIPESQAFWVEQGMKARVIPAATPGKGYAGTVQSIEVTPRGNPASLAFLATIDPGEVDHKLIPGMRTTVIIDAGKRENVVLIPLAAVTNDKVTVRKDGKTEPRDVKLGKTDGNQVEVKHGLHEGEEIVLPKK